MKYLKPTHFGRAGILFTTVLMAVSGSCQALATRPFGPNLNRPLSFDYVAIGDSITTGSSITSCQEDRRASPWGCSERHLPAVPYPDRVAIEVNDRFSNDPADYTPTALRKGKIDLYRAGIWGYTLQEAIQAQKAGHNQQGSWTPQLEAITQARQFVTGMFGINDLHFSDVGKWARLYVQDGPVAVSNEARRMVAAQSADFDKLFAAFYTAKRNRVHVVPTLYYNPYSTNRSDCSELKDIGDRIVGALDADLERRSRELVLTFADFRRRFDGHGAGSQEAYVFGTECSIKGALGTAGPAWLRGRDVKQAIGRKFDPHPNNNGTIAMTKAIMEQINGAD